jgi:hypothetical protein
MKSKESSKSINRNQNPDIHEVRSKQENTVFPDTVRNSSAVDAYFLRGNPKAPIVQRVGAWIFGAFFFAGWRCVRQLHSERPLLG